MIHEFKNFTYIHEQGKAKLYKENQLIFKGNSWSGILMFLQQTDNAPEVRQMSQAQLEQREQPKVKQEKHKSHPQRLNKKSKVEKKKKKKKKSN